MNYNSIYDIPVTDTNGTVTNLSRFKGKAMLVVNTATACGLTPQLKGLQQLYDQFKDKGFEIVGFPSDQFAGQEPLDDKGISQFCMVNYGVSFKLYKKGLVKGSNAQPLFKFLAGKTSIGPFKNYPVWNFQKYLVDKNGRVVDAFAPWTKPESAKLTKAIEKVLS